MKFNNRQYIKKFGITGLTVSFIFIIIFVYAFRLQIIDHDILNNEVISNTIKQRKLPAPRGAIFDRNSVLLASTWYQNDLYIIPYYFHSNINIVCNDVGINCSELLLKITKAQLNRTLVAQNISDELAHKYNYISGLLVFRYAKRLYNTDSFVAHIVGYVGKINRTMLDVDNDDALYADDDFVGKSGIENIYNHELHGINGVEQYVVRANGLELLNPNRFLPQNKIIIEPIKGASNILSVDNNIQSVFAKEIGEKNGAAVMLDVHNGSVLAMYSSPTFNANNIKSVFGNVNHPLINRAISSYAPGSTFKIVTALAALESGVIDVYEKQECHGSYNFVGRTWHCWKHEGHGAIDLRDGIKRSCDIYFYQLAQKVGLKNIIIYAKKLGFGNPTNIDLDEESSGKLPVIRNNGGVLLNTVIGQGVVQVTPLQLANAYASIVNGGTLYVPKMLLGAKPTVLQYNYFKQTTINFLMDALYAVVNEENGTAYYSKVPDIEVGGKTGTAQIAGLDKKTKDNAWFVAYYPATNPKIVVCVFVEAGEHGSSVAKIAFKAIDEYRKKYALIKN